MRNTLDEMSDAIQKARNKVLERGLVPQVFVGIDANVSFGESRPPAIGSCLARSLDSHSRPKHDALYDFFAANGLKSDFGGQHNEHSNNVYAWVGDCWGAGNSDRFVNNTCVSSHSDDGGFTSDCRKGPLMQVTGNRIYNGAGALHEPACDPSNVAAGKWPAPDKMVEMGRAVLQWH